jgi:DNA-binding MarR family transcriptional regulator
MRKEVSSEDQVAQSVHLLSRHAHVLLILAKDPMVTIREISFVLDVTERTVLRILNQLEEQGFLRIERRGRNNSYRVLLDAESSSRFENSCKIRDVIGLMNSHEQNEKPRAEGI